MPESKSAQLENCTKTNTPRFSLAGLKTTAKVVSIYDGDTITAAFDTCGLGFFLHNIRILDIDSPEIKAKTQQEKTAAMESRDYLRSLIDGQLVDLQITMSDKYGRLLAHVKRKSDGLDISRAMLDSKHAVAYDGGARKPYVPNDDE